jgi:tetratricopeptide (TPR) repeat protein
VKQDASNIGWQRELSVVLGDLGDLSLDRGDYDNASDYLTRSCLIAEKVASLKPMDCGCRSDWVRAIVAVGDMEDARGRSDEARTAYERATSIAEQHTEEESLSTSLKDRELVLERLALVLQRTDLDASLAIHRRRLSVAEQYASLEPLAEDAQRDLALAHKNIGRALQLKGDTQGAMCSFVSSLDIAERLYRKNSAAVVNQAVLSDSHERIAEIQSLRGNYDAAIESCRHCVAIRKTLAAIDPSNVQAQRGLAISYGRFGRALMEKGTFDAAREAFQDGVAIREQLTAQNPNDLKRLGELGIGYREIGDAEEQLGNHVTAMGYQEKAAAIAAKCAESDDTLDNLHLLASSCQRMGSMCCLQGRLDTGIDWHRRCVSALEKSIARDNSRSSTKEAIALAYQFLGDALVSQGNQHEARANYVKSRQVFEKLVATDRTNVVWQENLVGALMRVGLSFKWDEKLTEAVKSLEDAAALGDQLLKGSTGQVALRMDAAARHFYLFELYSRKEQPSKAAVHLRRYRQRLVELKQCGERVDGGFDLDKKLWDVTKMIPDDSRVDEWISGELFTKTLARCSRGHRRPDGADSRETE